MVCATMASVLDEASQGGAVDRATPVGTTGPAAAALGGDEATVLVLCAAALWAVGFGGRELVDDDGMVEADHGSPEGVEMQLGQGRSEASRDLVHGLRAGVEVARDAEVASRIVGASRCVSRRRRGHVSGGRDKEADDVQAAGRRAVETGAREAHGAGDVPLDFFDGQRGQGRRGAWCHVGMLHGGGVRRAGRQRRKQEACGEGRGGAPARRELGVRLGPVSSCHVSV